MDKDPNFEKFYSHFLLVKDKLSNLIIPLRHANNIESGYHYITATIGVL